MSSPVAATAEYVRRLQRMRSKTETSAKCDLDRVEFPVSKAFSAILLALSCVFSRQRAIGDSDKCIDLGLDRPFDIDTNYL